MNRKLLLILPFAVAAFSSCNKDDEKSGTPLNPVEAKVSINNMSQELETDIVTMFEADGAGAIMNLSDLMTDYNGIFDGRQKREKGYVKEVMLKKAQDFKSIFIPQDKMRGGKSQGETGFNYQENLGIYEWNADSADFSKTGPSNFIEIKFPEEGSASNNVSLKITEYSEVLLEVEEYSYYDHNTGEDVYATTTEFYPTALSAELAINEVKQVGLSFAMTYNEKAFPVSAAIGLFLNPFDYSIAYKEEGSTATRFTSSIKKSGDIIIDNNYKIEFTDAEKLVVNILDGYSQIRAYKIVSRADAKKITEMEDGGNINDFIQMALFKRNDKIGDIIFESTVSEDEGFAAYVNYGDGSKEKLEDIFAPVIRELEKFLEEFGNV